MNFMKLVNPDNLGAEMFVDAQFNPIMHVFTIKHVAKEKPPTGGKEKACFYFEETDKKAFLATGEVKIIARTLRKAETDEWKGVKLGISCAQKRFAGQPVMGMVVVEINGKPVQRGK